MSSDGRFAVAVEGMGKCYHMYARPSDRLKQIVLRGRKQLYREFWALRGVSFQVERGESFAIIGRNGSGKSTLLQIIAGTLAPTTGRAEVHGRVGALLEGNTGHGQVLSHVREAIGSAQADRAARPKAAVSRVLGPARCFLPGRAGRVVRDHRPHSTISLCRRFSSRSG